MSSMQSPQYVDAGCPSQCSSGKYSAMAGSAACSQKCQSTYANPSMSDSGCPSYCNFFDSYSTVPNMYSPNTIYIPPNSAARIYNYPIGVNSDYRVSQPQIVNWAGQTQSNNLSGQPLEMNPVSLMNKLKANLAAMGSKLTEMNGIQTGVKKSVSDFAVANSAQKQQIASDLKTLAMRSKSLNDDIMNLNSDNISTAVNIAPFVSRNDVQNAAVNASREASQAIAKKSQSINNQVILLNDLHAQRVVSANPPAAKNLSAESFRYARRG